MGKRFKRALVTGGTGFIGSHLTDLLLEHGCEVTVFDNLSGGQPTYLKQAASSPKFRFIQGDIRNPTDLKAAFSQIDWVFHLAGLPGVLPSIENPRAYFETHVDGTYNVLEAAHQAGVQRFIYAASSSCYKAIGSHPTPETAPLDPQSPYALTKLLGEQLVLHWAQTYQLPALSLRLFNVFGPRLSLTGAYGAVLGIFLSQKLQRKPLTVIGDGKQTRDFIYVTDVAEAFYAAAQSNLSNEVMNVGSGCSHSINQLAQLFEAPVVHLPKRAGEADFSLADVTKISQKLSWKPKISLQEGVRRLLEQGIASPR